MTLPSVVVQVSLIENDDNLSFIYH